jgi:DNA-binding response OmpR family regulator
MNIYIVEDDPLQLSLYKDHLEDKGHCIVGTSGNVEVAMREIETLKPSLVLVDYMLEGFITGLDLVRGLRRSLQMPIILWSVSIKSGSDGWAVDLPNTYLLSKDRLKDLNLLIKRIG